MTHRTSIARLADDAPERKIRVDPIWPPIPTRAFDYCAVYDGDEPDDDGNINAGYGKTPEDAIQDLRNNFPDGAEP